MGSCASRRQCDRDAMATDSRLPERHDASPRQPLRGDSVTGERPSRRATAVARRMACVKVQPSPRAKAMPAKDPRRFQNFGKFNGQFGATVGTRRIRNRGVASSQSRCRQVNRSGIARRSRVHRTYRVGGGAAYFTADACEARGGVSGRVSVHGGRLAQRG